MKILGSWAAATLTGAGLLSRAVGPGQEASVPAPVLGVFAADPARALPAAAPLPEHGLQRPLPSGLGTVKNDEGAAAYRDLSDLSDRIGREADFLRDELIYAADEHLGRLAEAKIPFMEKAKVPLGCLTHDIELDRKTITAAWNPLPLGLDGALKDISAEVAGPGADGLLPRLQKAQGELSAGRCLLDAVKQRFADSDQALKTIDCLRRLGTAQSVIVQAQRELANLWAPVDAEWAKDRAVLEPMAKSKTHPDRLRAAWLLGFAATRLVWYKKHPAETLASLQLPKMSEADAARHERFAAQARNRRDELGKAMDAFRDAWDNRRPVTKAWAKARNAWLELDLAAQNFSAGGPGRQDAEAEGARHATAAFLDLMSARRLLQGLEKDEEAK
ncbi:MAG: hypothetical protein HY925_01995 [Elusimicrobia bacterium]|nr:hypothetical protein [Elusimicrobiota bacterium]